MQIPQCRFEFVSLSLKFSDHKSHGVCSADWLMRNRQHLTCLIVWSMDVNSTGNNDSETFDKLHHTVT